MPGHCKALSEGPKHVRGGSANWNGSEWNVSLKANEYGINDIESCMKIACLPFKECVGVSYHDRPYCYVWDTCDFNNLIGGKMYTTLKKKS